MTGDISNVEITILKNLLLCLNDESKLFYSNIYNSFNLGYVNNCSDSFIKSIAVDLEKTLKEIEHDYLSIIKWLDNYINNIYSLESRLSDIGFLGAISDLELRNYVDYKLPILETYNKGV